MTAIRPTRPNSVFVASQVRPGSEADTRRRISKRTGPPPEPLRWFEAHALRGSGLSRRRNERGRTVTFFSSATPCTIK